MVIEFHYDTGNIRRLDRQRHQLSAYETSDFLINGAQGEVIKTIEVDLDHEDVESSWKHGRLRSFKVSGYSPDLVLLNQAIIRLYLTPNWGLIDLYQSRTTETFAR